VSRNTASFPFLVALVVATIGCSGDTEASNPAGATVRDSADIRIVENGDPALAPEWRIEPLPIASIGNGMGDPRLELHDVTSIALQDDGSVVVANTGTHEVRFYSADGVPGPVAGGPGEGPGEFVGEIQLANMPGDSILAYDWTQRRATILAPGGIVTRTIDLRHLDPNVDLRGVMADGSLLLSLRHLTRMAPDRLNTDSVVFVRTDSRGAPIDQLGWTRFTRIVFATYEGMPVIDELPFGPAGSAAASGEGLVVLDGQSPEYVVRSRRGDARPDRPVPGMGCRHRAQPDRIAHARALARDRRVPRPRASNGRPRRRSLIRPRLRRSMACAVGARRRGMARVRVRWPPDRATHCS
jgi:hypothetical protein